MPRTAPTCYNAPMPILLTLAAVAVGAMIAIQPAINAQIGRSLGHPIYGSLTNFLIGLAALALITAVLIRPAIPTGQAATAAPWWAWLGGLLGAAFVTASILLVPKLGAVLFIGAMLCGQLLSAALLDQFALAGLPHRPLTPTRIAGLALLLVGLILVQHGATTPAEPVKTSSADTSG